MKELSIEEKAKAYDRALEIAKAWCKLDNNDLSNDDLKTIFPELKESEDERIRKELIFYLRYQHSISENFEDIGKWIAWLEKQKPIQNINKEDEEVRQYIVRIMKQRDINVPMVQKSLNWLEKQVPVDKEKVLIGARIDVALSIINYLDNNSVGMCLSNMECEDIEDACVNSKWTKLYNYMKKKLEKQGDDNKEYWRGYREDKQEILDKYAELEKQGEQKPAWSEEDEKMVANLVDYFKVDDALQYTEKQVVDWLKSLKGRAQPQPKQE